jgi:hypothetical protein
MTYIDDARAAVDAELPGLDPQLLDLYTLLALTHGVSVDLRDVHDAWAVWRAGTNPAHRSIVPFGQLTAEVQGLDRKYADGIRRAAETIHATEVGA